MRQKITTLKIEMVRLLKMRRHGHLETSETNYPVTKSHIPEELRSQLHRYESQKTSLIEADFCNERKTPTENADGKPQKNTPDGKPQQKTLTENPRKTHQTENPDRKR
jgi:hypothetical protein